mmetsp:Transcript_10440/g.42574  ORF Transcript_10440/g.42574 Transcript_10440/m.42574 type:complete len:200 (+) Transcript_10440:956-1555(+)
MAGQLLLEGVQHLAQHLVIGLVLEVDPDELLGTSDHAQFDDGVQLLVVAQHGGDVMLVQQLAQLLGGLVLADHGQQRGLCAEGAHIQRDIGGTAQPQLLTLNPHDRHRGFRRDAIHGTVPVAVQHHIADDENASCGELRLARYRVHWPRPISASISPHSVCPISKWASWMRAVTGLGTMMLSSQAAASLPPSRPSRPRV